MAHLTISLLGTFRVILDGAPVTTFESDKVRALLAYLAVESDRPHRRERLTGLLWPERPEQNARQNLSQALFNLRCAIGDRDAEPPFLVITHQTLQFNQASDHWLDTAAFAALLAACQEHHHRRLEACNLCLDRLRQAVTLYRGTFLEGFSLSDSAAFEEWALLEGERFHRLALEALRDLAHCHEQRCEYEPAIQYARRAVELAPWQEETHRQLMRLLALSGQRSAGLAQHESCRRILAEELGVEPDTQTTMLYERIRDRTEILSRAPAPPNNLPAPLTPFVGREEELTQIEERLQDPSCRLLTLTGPGGIGKTRLALEAAAAQMIQFTHGVFLVSLAPLASADAIVPAVAEALGFSFHEEGEPEQQLRDYLRQKTLLLIMDNFEHLLARPERRQEIVEGPGQRDGADRLVNILRTAPDLTILATSRTRLNVQGEHLFPVFGMDLPEQEDSDDVAQCGAVKLFLQTARRVQPDFAPADDELSDVTEVCRLVQGMPLGILLAAPWVERFTPAEIVARISGQIGQNLDILATDLRGVPERQRSIRAVFDHSWNLLTQREQATLQQLSVFRGGFTQRAAQEVAGAPPEELTALFNKSLLQRAPEGRYEMHELVRQCAAEKIERLPAAGEAYATGTAPIMPPSCNSVRRT